MLISLNSNAIVALKYLFGLPDDKSGTESFPEENVKLLQKMATVLSKINDDNDYSATPDVQTSLCQVLLRNYFTEILCFPLNGLIIYIQ